MKELQFLLYSTPQDNIKVDVVVKEDTIWLSQKGMAMLFDVDRTSITKHLKNIFETGELKEEVVCEEFAHTTQHGAMAGKQQTSSTKFYNLDAIISVGYRVSSRFFQTLFF